MAKRVKEPRGGLRLPAYERERLGSRQEAARK